MNRSSKWQELKERDLAKRGKDMNLGVCRVASREEMERVTSV